MAVIGRVSGVADHFAEDDEHAIAITRSIVANLNLGNVNNIACPNGGGSGGEMSEPAQVEPHRQEEWDEPLFDPREMGSIIPTDTKKPFDVRKASRGELWWRVEREGGRGGVFSSCMAVVITFNYCKVYCTLTPSSLSATTWM